MSICRRVFLIATLALLAAAPGADAAKTRTLTGQVVGSPFVVGKKVAVPVLVDRRTVKRTRLKAPVGLLMLKKSKKVAAPKRKRVEPALLRAGDRLRARAKVGRSARQSAHWRIGVRKAKVTRRSPSLSPAEILLLVQALDKDLNGLDTALTNFAKYVQAGFAKQGSDIATLQKGLTDLAAAVTALEKRVAAMEAGLPGLESRLQAQIDALTTQLAGLKTQLDGLGTQLNTLQTSLATLQTQVNGLTGDVTTLKAQMATVQGQIAALQTSVTALQTNMTALCDSALIGAIC